MAEPFIGEIQMFGGNYPPAGWEFCNGQLLDVNEYYSLFTLIGTTYGGDGVTNFAVPDLRGRIPLSRGDDGYGIGQKIGTETVSLSAAQNPPHGHGVMGNKDPGSNFDPTQAVPAGTVSPTKTGSHISA